MNTNSHQNSARDGELLFKEEAFAIVGAAMEVYNELGFGFLESVYQEGMERESRLRSIPFESQKVLRIKYKGEWLDKHFIADLVCFGKIIVELKCVPKISDVEIAQALNYLKATGLSLCLIINFGNPAKLEFKRVIR
ncbi:MAG: GxxExxY protein [Planctomycetes bacterium]|jgi:GxxExxY protein|nr:GxxExxY protein [Planctomycetota bacterium]